MMMVTSKWNEPAPTHHIDEALLMDYAVGATSEPESLIIATHLALCPHCRATVRDLEEVGGALLDDVAPEAVAEDALAAEQFSPAVPVAPAANVVALRMRVGSGVSKPPAA